MAEFAGYVGNLVPPTDWGKIGTDLFDKYNKVKEEREAEREKIDNDFTEAFAKIGDYEQTTDQSLNELVARGANDIRDAFKTQYDLLKKGAINMSDYKLFKSTSSADWSSFNKAVKSFGANITNAQKLITEGKMSGFGQYNMLNYSKLGDLKYAKIMPNPQTGRLYLAQVDPKTGTIASENDVYSPSAMLTFGNLVDYKVDINDGVSTFLKRVADYGGVIDLGGGKIKVTEDARKNPAYQEALTAQVKSLTHDARSTSSILYDYIGGYKFYKSESEKKDLINQGVPKDNLIKVDRVNGVYEPVPTATQTEVARTYTKNQIEVGVGRKESMTAGWAPNKPDQAKEPSPSEKKMAYLYNSAVGLSKAYRNNPNDPAVVAKIKSLYSDNPGQVKIAPLRDAENRVVGFDVFEYDQNGNLVKGTMPSGAFERAQIDPNNFYQKMTSRDKRGEEYGDVEMARRSWINSGGNEQETFFEYPSQRKGKGKVKPGAFDNLGK